MTFKEHTVNGVVAVEKTVGMEHYGTFCEKQSGKTIVGGDAQILFLRQICQHQIGTVCAFVYGFDGDKRFLIEKLVGNVAYHQYFFFIFFCSPDDDFFYGACVCVNKDFHFSSPFWGDVSARRK